MKFKTWKEMRVSGAVSAGLATVLGLILLIYDSGQGLRWFSYDVPFILRPNLKPEGVAIVYMDEDSQSALHQELFGRWDRNLHAQLLDHLKAYSAKAVAFDLLFDEPTTNDTAFIEAVKKHGRVIVGARFLPVGLGAGVSFWPLRRPIDELQRIALWGVAETPDADDIVRQHYCVARHSTNLFSLAWQVARLSSDRPMPDPFERRWLNYYGPPGIIPWESYVQVLSNAVPAAALSNKVVFVGGRIVTGFIGGKGTDDLPTPFSRWTGTKSPGVEINATAYLNLIRREWLTRLSPGREFLLFSAVGILFGFGLNLFRPISVAAISVGGMLLIFAAGLLLMWHYRVWFPWAIASLVQIPTAAVCAVLFHTQRLHWEMQDREKQVAELARARASTPAQAGPMAGATTPSVVMRRQIRESFQTPSPAAAPDAPTVVFADNGPAIPDCTLLRRIGVGAFGEVWIGTNVIGAYRAIKVVYRANFSDDRPYEREFEGIKNFDPISRSHPGLVHVLHIGRDNDAGYFYYLMELADDFSGRQPFDPRTYDAKTLGKDLQRRAPLPVHECIQLGLALTDCLSFLHERRLIHRDIKPSNIIYVDGKPKLADVGLVTQVGEGQTLVGTEGFYDPEQTGSPQGDLYSLGKVLYEAFTGLSRLKYPELPALVDLKTDRLRFQSFNKIILRACESNVRKRYASAREMHDDLLRLNDPRSPWRDFFKKTFARSVNEHKSNQVS
jgi:CHASE2 domain-containing sensor protein